MTASPRTKALSIPPYPSTCAEIMRLVTFSVQESDSVLTAARLMRDENIGFVPVRDAHHVVTGVVTDRDVAVRLVAEGSDAATMSVRAVMTRGPVTCGPNDTIARAQTLMRKHHITRIIIVDAMRHLVGVLSLSDMAQYARPGAIGQTLRAIAERKYGPERP